MSINIKIDASNLQAWARDLSAYKLKLALKNAVNRSGRAARKQFGVDTAADIGVSAARARKGISAFRAASPGNLKASFDANPLRIGIKSVAGASITKSGGLVASTHRNSGGGSASLSIPRAFLLRSNGGQVVMIRKGPGRKNLKALFAETPKTALAQENAAPRRGWEKSVNSTLRKEIETGLAAVLNGASPPSDSGSND